MASSVRATLVSVFDKRAQAEKAMDELRLAGFRADQVGVAVHTGHATQPPSSGDEAEGPAEGAAAGAIAGGSLGALMGAVATGLIPGVGWVIGAGLLAGIVGGAAIGGAAGGLIGALVGLGLSEEEARFYDAHLRAGRTVITVRTEDRYDEAAAILKRHGGYDVSAPNFPPTAAVS